MSVLVFLCIFSLLLSPHTMLSIVKGSDTAVSVQPAVTFPAADVDNKIAGFGWFKYGFTLEDATTSCVFDSIYPVSGDVDLRGGTLQLNQDLLFKGTVDLQGLGTIVGNDHVIELSPSISQLPSGAHELEDVRLCLSSSLAIKGSITCKGVCVICGVGSTITLEQLGELIIASNATLVLRDLTIRGVAGTNIRCVDDTGLLVLDNVTWLQNDDVTFAQGTMKIAEQVTFISASGNYSFLYESSQTSIIDNHSQWCISDNINFTIGRKEGNGAIEPLGFVDETATLKLDNCKLTVTPQGVNFTKGKILFDRKVKVAIQSTSISNGLTVGNGNEDEDSIIQFDPGAHVLLQSGHFVYNNGRSDRTIALSKSASLIREQASSVYLATSAVFPAMTLGLASNLVPPIQIASGKTLEYKDTKIVLPNVEFEITSHRYDLFTFYLDGDDEIFLAKGELPLNVRVSGTNNAMHGNGNMAGVIIFQDPSAQFTCDMYGSIEKSILLNGGTLQLGGDLRLGCDAQIVGGGTVELATHRLTLGNDELTWTSDVVWEGNGASIELNANISLLSTWTINGSCTIDGNGNTLHLDQAGQLVVTEGSTLKLQNMRIAGVFDNNIRCLEDAGTLVLDNVTWLQDGDYTFSKGTMLFKDKVDCSGRYTFVYDSSQTSSIDSKSKWIISNGLRLQIGKKSPEAIEPLFFTNETSSLQLDNSVLHVPAGGGMSLVRGVVECNRDAEVVIDSSSFADGLTLGDGTPEGDMMFEMFPGTSVRFTGGHLTYDITSGNGLKSRSETAKVVRTSDSIFYLKQDLNLSDITFDVATNSVLLIEEGKTLTYDNMRVSHKEYEFNLTGSAYNFFTRLLAGNDELFMSRGIFPAYLLIQGTGNKIHGNGAIGGVVTLVNSDAQLLYTLNGVLENNLVLNGGTVVLGADLHFKGNGGLVGSGVIDVESHKIVFGQREVACTDPLRFTGMGGAIELNAQLSLSSTWTLHGDCSIIGNGNTLVLEEGGEIVVDSGSTCKLQDIRILGVSGTNIRCCDNDGKITLQNVVWVQDDAYTFTTGSIHFVEKVTMTGPYACTYQSDQTSMIHTRSHLLISGGLRLELGKQAGNIVEPLVFEDMTSVLHMDNCVLNIVSEGVQFTKGRVICSRDVEIEVNSTAEEKGFILGDGTPAGDMVFELYPGATARFTKGLVVYDVTSGQGIQSRSNTSKIMRYVDSVFLLKQNLVLSDIALDVANGALLTIAQGKNLSYKNMRVMQESYEFDMSASRYNWYTRLLGGDDSIFMVRGEFPAYLLVMGTGNKIHGNGSFKRVITLANGDAQLDCNLQGSLLDPIVLSGGTLSLKNDIRFADNGTLVGDGTVQLGSHTFNLGPFEHMLYGSIAWEGNSGTIDLRSKTKLHNTWTFSGACTIDGNNNNFHLKDAGELLLEDGATLTLKNMKIVGTMGQNIRCLGPSATVILENIEWAQDGDYTFVDGLLIMKGKTLFRGDGCTFTYRSDQACTLWYGTQCTLDQGFTFKYDPVSAAKNLLVFKNDSATLLLRDALLHAPATGLQLTLGRLRVKGSSCISSDIVLSEDGTPQNEGVTFGDGSAANDFTCNITTGATLKIAQGSLIYKNINAASWKSGDSLSSLYMMVGTKLVVDETLNLDQSRLLLSEQAALRVADGKDIIGSIFTVD